MELNQFENTSFERELSESQQAALQEIDEGVGLGRLNSVDVVGVFAGVKPSCRIDVKEGAIAKYQAIIDKLDLETTELTIEPGRRILFISTDSDLAHQLSEPRQTITTTDETSAFEEMEYKIGQLLGYPATATKHYLERLNDFCITGEFSPFVEVPEYYGDARYFVNIILSPDNYQDEMANYIEPLCQAVKLYTPKLYERVVQAAMAKI